MITSLCEYIGQKIGKKPNLGEVLDYLYNFPNDKRAIDFIFFERNENKISEGQLIEYIRAIYRGGGIAKLDDFEPEVCYIEVEEALNAGKIIDCDYAPIAVIWPQFLILNDIGKETFAEMRDEYKFHSVKFKSLLGKILYNEDFYIDLAKFLGNSPVLRDFWQGIKKTQNGKLAAAFVNTGFSPELHNKADTFLVDFFTHLSINRLSFAEQFLAQLLRQQPLNDRVKDSVFSFFKRRKFDGTETYYNFIVSLYTNKKAFENALDLVKNHEFDQSLIDYLTSYKNRWDIAYIVLLNGNTRRPTLNELKENVEDMIERGDDFEDSNLEIYEEMKLAIK